MVVTGLSGHLSDTAATTPEGDAAVFGRVPTGNLEALANRSSEFGQHKECIERKTPKDEAVECGLPFGHDGPCRNHHTVGVCGVHGRWTQHRRQDPIDTHYPKDLPKGLLPFIARFSQPVELQARQDLCHENLGTADGIPERRMEESIPMAVKQRILPDASHLRVSLWHQKGRDFRGRQRDQDSVSFGDSSGRNRDRKGALATGGEKGVAWSSREMSSCRLSAQQLSLPSCMVQGATTWTEDSISRWCMVLEQLQQQ